MHKVLSTNAALSIDAVVQIWLHELLRVRPDIPHSVQSERAQPCTNIESPLMACDALAGGDTSAAVDTTLVTAAAP